MASLDDNAVPYDSVRASQAVHHRRRAASRFLPAALLAALLSVLASPPCPGAGEDLARARRLLATGKYAEAAEIYERSAESTPEAAIGWARALESSGHRDGARRALEKLPGAHAAVQAELARLAFERGDRAAAQARADAALRIDAGCVLARWLQGELHRTAGRLAEAEKEYRRLIDFYNARDEIDAESLRWIARAAAEYARWNRMSDQFQLVVNELCPDALKQDPTFWAAHYEAGLLYLEKYNQADAAAEFKAALELNPNSAEVHAAMALLDLAEHEPRKAEESVARALEINAELLDAWLVKADLAWANFQPEEARRLLKEHALPLNPVSEESLGRLAACCVLLDGPPKKGVKSRFDALADEVNARNPHAGEFYLALASWLDDRYRDAEAEQAYRQAITRMPRQLGANAGLGLMWMRTGREADARKALDAAFKEDPFHVRVRNMLELLKRMERMETLDTGHCLVKIDPEQDKTLAVYAVPYVEKTYRELCQRFGYESPQKPLLEIFGHADGASGHQWFSTRMVGLPFIGTVGASTGRIVAIVSPTESGPGGKFNWARVLRHELVHVVTLQQTRFNIPHWFTEGLAVWSEGYPRPAEWNDLLATRVPAGELFTLETINFAFSSPNSGDDWQMAYCQAELYVEYMLQGRTPEVLRRMLAAYTDNLSTPEAVRRVFGVSVAEFERGYLEYVKKQAAEVSGHRAAAAGNFKELLKAQKAKPDNPDLAAELAYAYFRRGISGDAEDLARNVVKNHPKHTLAVYVLARLDVKAGRVKEAAASLEGCLDPKQPDLRVLNLLANLKVQAEEYAAASQLYEQGAKLQPYDARWLRALAALYAKTGEKGKLEESLRRLAQADGDNFTARKELARLASERKDYVKAAQWANQALQIDVTDAEIHCLLAESLAASHNDAGAIREYEIALGLGPSEPGTQIALADAYIQDGKPQEARRVLLELLKKVPDHPAAKTLLESLKEPAPP